jgi:hypothetical protein
VGNLWARRGHGPCDPSLVKRAESALVTEFTKSLTADHKASCLLVGSGVIDLHIDSPQRVEIIEAESSSRHRKVREALGQILDYAHSALRRIWPTLRNILGVCVTSRLPAP